MAGYLRKGGIGEPLLVYAQYDDGLQTRDFSELEANRFAFCCSRSVRPIIFSCGGH